MSLRSLSQASHIFGNSSLATIPLVSAVPTQRVYVYSLIITMGTPAVTVTLTDTSAAAMSQAFQLLANGAITLDYRMFGDPWWQSGTGLGIQFVQSGTTNVSYDVWYLQGP
jgi:hypothetical protein